MEITVAETAHFSCFTRVLHMYWDYRNLSPYNAVKLQGWMAVLMGSTVWMEINLAHLHGRMFV